MHTGAFPGEPAPAIPEGLNPIASEFFEYYAMERGHHPRSVGGFTQTSSMAFANFPLVNYIESISPRPILFIIGENAHSRYFTEDLYEKAAEPKELYVVPGARYIDLYDRVDMIPFDKLDDFFSEHLNGASQADAGSHEEIEQGQASQTLYGAGSLISFTGPAEFFTGDVRVDLLFPANENADYSGAYVTFAAGARTAWHLHPA